MSAFNPATFTVPVSKTLDMGEGCFWGGGHTADTDPVRQGWKASTTGPEGSVVIVGQRGITGCATIRWMTRGNEQILDIAYYSETPEMIARAIKRGTLYASSFDPRYEQSHDYPGIGLTILQKIKALRWGVVGV